MARWLDWLRGNGKAGGASHPAAQVGTFESREHAGSTLPLSLAEDQRMWRGLGSEYVGLPNNTPFSMLQVYRFLSDAIPDISDAVWTWKRLCQTGYDIEILKPRP